MADKIAETKQLPKASAGRKYIEVPVKSAIPFWVAALVWVIAALFFPMYKLVHIIIIAVAAAIAAIITKLVLPKETVYKEVAFASGNLDIDAMVAQINDSLDKMSSVREKIGMIKPMTAARIGKIESTTAKIRDAVVESPRDLISIRRFMNYYLPTSEKLMEKYAYAISQDTESANISETVKSIEGALAQIDTAFDRQLDALFADDALDITTDITVLEGMMTRDNLK